MLNSIPCSDCKNEIPQPATSCPHCGRPGIFWNVLHANEDDERIALDNRYTTAKADAKSRGADSTVQDFENAVAHSTAVIARSETEMYRLVSNTRQLYRGYHQQIEGGLRLPDGDEWNLARGLVDTLLFPNYKEQILFASLTLDGIGLSNYGSCSFTLRDDMIEHRASIFEENSILFTEKQREEISRKAGIPKGFRANWMERGKLCVAKLAGRIDSATTPNQYSTILLKQGASPEDDEFVEVHIFGPITVLTMAQVTVTTPKPGPKRTIVRALKSKLAKHGIPIT